MFWCNFCLVVLLLGLAFCEGDDPTFCYFRDGKALCGEEGVKARDQDKLTVRNIRARVQGRFYNREDDPQGDDPGRFVRQRASNSDKGHIRPEPLPFVANEVKITPPPCTRRRTTTTTTLPPCPYASTAAPTTTTVHPCETWRRNNVGEARKPRGWQSGNPRPDSLNSPSLQADRNRNVGRSIGGRMRNGRNLVQLSVEKAESPIVTQIGSRMPKTAKDSQLPTGLLWLYTKFMGEQN